MTTWNRETLHFNLLSTHLWLKLKHEVHHVIYSQGQHCVSIHAFTTTLTLSGAGLSFHEPLAAMG